MARQKSALRRRDIGPGFWTNEDLVDLGSLTRLFFMAMWCQADREGRLEDRPRRIRLNANMDDISKEQAEDFVSNLAHHGFILRYSADGESFIQIVNFNKHQRVHPNEKPSEIPPPEGVPKVNQGCTNGEPMDNQGEPKVLDYALGPSVPSVPSVPSAKESNVPRKRGTTYTPEFESIWEAYPKRLGGNPKKTAAKAYQARIKAGDTTYEQALASVNAYKAACEAKGKVGTEYVMQTSSFFGQKEGFREPWLTTCETVNPEQQAALRRKIADKRRMMQYWIKEGDIAAARECAVTPELQQEFYDMVQSREIFAAQRQEGGE